MRGVILYLVAFVGLLLIAIWITQKNKTDTRRGAPPDFYISDTASITNIQLISESNDTLTLTRNDSLWRVNHMYPANANKIAALLKTIKKQRITAPVPNKNRDSVNRVLEKKGNGVIIKSNQKTELSYIVARISEQNNDSYMKIKNSSYPYFVNIQSYSIAPDKVYRLPPLYWRNKTILHLKPQKLSSIRITYPNNKSQSFNLKYVKDSWELDHTPRNKTLSRKAVKRYLSYFGDKISFDKTPDLSKSKRDSVISSQPKLIFKLRTKEGEGIQFKLYPIKRKSEGKEKRKIDPHNAYIEIPQDSLLVQISYYEFDPVLKEKSYFLK